MIVIVLIEEVPGGLNITMMRDEKTLIQYEVFEPYLSDKAICGYIAYHLGTIKQRNN